LFYLLKAAGSALDFRNTELLYNKMELLFRDSCQDGERCVYTGTRIISPTKQIELELPDNCSKSCKGTELKVSEIIIDK